VASLNVGRQVALLVERRFAALGRQLARKKRSDSGATSYRQVALLVEPLQLGPEFLSFSTPGFMRVSAPSSAQEPR
jgi:hypothetical protein